MSTAAPEALDRKAIPWLFASALATTLPHIEYQPAWFSALASLIFTWGAWLWWRGDRLPGRWLLVLLVAAGCAVVLIEFRTLLGRDAGVAMLFLFMAMKLLELKSRRDAYIVVNLGYFLLLTHYFHSQSIPTGLWLLTAMVIVTATLIRLHGGPASRPGPTVRYAGLMILQAVPFLFVLYLLFPRVSGPLWGLPQDAAGGKTGLSDKISPGTIADLALSSEIAFRVRFEDGPPHRDQLYWRGPVMDSYDGVTWSRSGSIYGRIPAIQALSRKITYEITLEPHGQRWLLALDAPTAVSPEGTLSSTLSAVSKGPLSQRQRYSFTSSPSYRFNVVEDASVRERSTWLPADSNPKTRALAEEWRRADPRPAQLIQRALTLFREQEFTYTLNPPLLGRNPVDEFLLRTRQGFCEHYASAFVVLMRSAGLPARVVGGYLGGEVNPIDGYFTVRQSDAHAWAEVWLEGQGWVRVDPTAAVSPNRVEAGLAASIPANESLPSLIRTDAQWLRDLRYRWEAANNAWNQWVLGYTPERQRELMSRLGWPNADWKAFMVLLLPAFGLALLMVAVWTLYHRPRIDPAQKLWHHVLIRLRRRRMICEPWETPMAFAHRLSKDHPELASSLEIVAQAYYQARYGSGPSNLADLKAAIARLP